MRLKAGCAAMTFLEAFTKYGPDVERIGEALGITPQEADRLINDLMDRRYQKRAV
jgi:DNA-binding IclR family transcriptional regulator